MFRSHESVSFVHTGIVEFMVNQTTPATVQFSSQKEFDLFIANQLVPVIICILPDGQQGHLWEAFLELANLGRTTPLLFRHSSQLVLAKGLGLSPDIGGIIIARPPRYV